MSFFALTPLIRDWDTGSRGFRRSLVGRRHLNLIDNRLAVVAIGHHECQDHAGYHEQRRQNGRRPGQQIGLGPPRHKTATTTTTAHAKRPALAALQQHRADQGKDQNDVNDEQYLIHR
jgi:hypothetical protein